MLTHGEVSLLLLCYMYIPGMGAHLDGEAAAGIVLACNAGRHAVVSCAQAVNVRLGVAHPLVLRKEGLHVVGGVAIGPAAVLNPVRQWLPQGILSRQLPFSGQLAFMPLATLAP